MLYDTTERKAKAKQAHENELLEIFCLLEQNNFHASKEAALRYQSLMGIKTPADAFEQAKSAYRKYVNL